MTPEALMGLEEAFQASLALGHAQGIEVLGYGEISTVVALKGEGVGRACKRLPPFRDRARFERYKDHVEVYIERLRVAGVEVVATEILAVPIEGGLAAWCVQPILAPAGLGERHLAGLDEPEAHDCLARIIDRALGVVSETLGLDAQVSNWWLEGEALVYLDVTTPLMRDEAGHNLIDLDLFMSMVPRPLRAMVRRFLIEDIIEAYHTPRRVVLDLLANLHKERLSHLIPGALARLGGRLQPVLTEREVSSYYRSDARTWAMLQGLRRADRWWQRKVRGRVYPFLLPGPIDRNV